MYSVGKNQRTAICNYIIILTNILPGVGVFKRDFLNITFL